MIWPEPVAVATAEGPLAVEAGAALSAEDEIRRLRAELDKERARCAELLEAKVEKPTEPRLADGAVIAGRMCEKHVFFLRCLGATSATPVLDRTYDLANAKVVGHGRFGYILVCRANALGSNVVLKLHPEHLAIHAMQEWAKSSTTPAHSHIVQKVDLVMHRDSTGALQELLRPSLENKVLAGEQLVKLPQCYFAIGMEYMDRGTVRDLLDLGALRLDGVGAITRQVASALAFLHGRLCAHNDLSPETIFLKAVQGSSGALVAKLDDSRVALQPQDCSRDGDLLAHTVWCMATGGSTTTPLSSSQERRAAVTSLGQAAKGLKPQDASIAQALAGIVGQLWTKQILMTQVAGMDVLQSLDLRPPALCQSKELAEELEKLAHSHLNRMAVTAFERVEASVQRPQMASSSTSLAQELQSEGPSSLRWQSLCSWPGHARPPG